MSRQSRSRLAILFAMIMVFMLSAGSVHAIGVTPGRSTIDFEPGAEVRKTITINNNEHKSFNAYVYAEGELSEYFTFDNEILVFRESDNSRQVTYTLKLPEELVPPGDHWGRIVIMELPETETGTSSGDTKILATVAVVHQVRIKVPYPGTFLQLDMTVQEAVPGEDVKFFVKVFNLGTEDVSEVTASIDILGPTNQVIDTIETDSISLKSMQKGELVGVWEADVNPGLYHATAIVRYDGEAGRVDKTFYVGNMIVDILDISVKDFTLGSVAKFDIYTESKWNQEIENVYAHMIIWDEFGNEVADFKSASLDMQPFEKAHLYAYWDTEGIREGEYTARLSIHYAGRTTEREIRTSVGLNSINIDFAGAGAVTHEEGILEQYPIIILVVVLIAINLGWFIYFRKRGN
jgi:hypothetical protein